MLNLSLFENIWIQTVAEEMNSLINIQSEPNAFLMLFSNSHIRRYVFYNIEETYPKRITHFTRMILGIANFSVTQIELCCDFRFSESQHTTLIMHDYFGILQRRDMHPKQTQNRQLQIIRQFPFPQGSLFFPESFRTPATFLPS